MWQEQNREKANAIAYAWRDKNPEKARTASKRSEVKRKYGLTLEEYNARVKNARCAVCQQKIEKQRHCMDHDHITGKVREVLCQQCNTGIGCFKDDPKLLEAAIAYVKRHADR